MSARESITKEVKELLKKYPSLYYVEYTGKVNLVLFIDTDWHFSFLEANDSLYSGFVPSKIFSPQFSFGP